MSSSNGQQKLQLYRISIFILQLEYRGQIIIEHSVHLETHYPSASRFNS